MTSVFEFTLIFVLPETDADPRSYLDALFEAGCDELPGIGRPGMIALAFAREAESAEGAVASAIRDVRHAIRGAELVEVSLDLVNLTDIAVYLGATKQNVRKYAAGEARRVKAVSPPPVFSGVPNLWHLYDVLTWFAKHTDRIPPRELIKTAKAAFAENLKTQKRRLAA